MRLSQISPEAFVAEIGFGALVSEQSAEQAARPLLLRRRWRRLLLLELRLRRRTRRGLLRRRRALLRRRRGRCRRRGWGGADDRLFRSLAVGQPDVIDRVLD